MLLFFFSDNPVHSHIRVFLDKKSIHFIPERYYNVWNKNGERSGVMNEDKVFLKLPENDKKHTGLPQKKSMNSTSQSIAVIEKIYSFYESWALKLKLACDQGCATCCTRNVTLTRAEGELILTALRQDEARLQWLTEKLPIKTEIGRPLMSTNEWARRCIEDGEMSEGLATQVLKPCPFLDEKKSCSIYHLRPFSCRCFGSTVDCSLEKQNSQIF